MEIKVFVEGPINANNYLLIDKDTRDAILIDCSSARNEFISAIKSLNIKLKCILLTHGHFDHLLGVDEFSKIFGVNAYVSENDLEQVKAVPDMMEMFVGMPPVEITSITNFIKDGDEFEFGNHRLVAIATPGHTRGGMCYLLDNNKLFSGDTLFQGSVGRCDLPGGSIVDIISSIKSKLFFLPDETIVYPGHGPSTTIQYEKNYNEILNV